MGRMLSVEVLVAVKADSLVVALAVWVADAEALVADVRSNRERFSDPASQRLKREESLVRCYET